MTKKIRCDSCGGFFPQEQIKLEILCTECLASEEADRQQRNEQDFELGSNYGRERGWYSDTFGDSFSDPYDY